MRERERKRGRGAVKSRGHSRLPFYVGFFGLKKGRSWGTECMQSGPVGRGDGGREEGEGGEGQGWDVILLFHIESCQTGGVQPGERKTSDFHSLTFYLNPVCTARTVKKPQMLQSLKPKENWESNMLAATSTQNLALNIW